MKYQLKAFLVTVAVVGIFVLSLSASAAPDWVDRPGTIANAISQPDGTLVYLDAVIVSKIKGRQNPGYFVIHESLALGQQDYCGCCSSRSPKKRPDNRR